MSDQNWKVEFKQVRRIGSAIPDMAISICEQQGRFLTELEIRGVFTDDERLRVADAICKVLNDHAPLGIIPGQEDALYAAVIQKDR